MHADSIDPMKFMYERLQTMHTVSLLTKLPTHQLDISNDLIEEKERWDERKVTQRSRTYQVPRDTDECRNERYIMTRERY